MGPKNVRRITHHISTHVSVSCVGVPAAVVEGFRGWVLLGRGIPDVSKKCAQNYPSYLYTCVSVSCVIVPWAVLGGGEEQLIPNSHCLPPSPWDS